MAGGKGKSIGGKGSGAKDSAGKQQKSHSAKAGLQVGLPRLFISRLVPGDVGMAVACSARRGKQNRVSTTPSHASARTETNEEAVKMRYIEVISL